MASDALAAQPPRSNCAITERRQPKKPLSISWLDDYGRCCPSGETKVRMFPARRRMRGERINAVDALPRPDDSYNDLKIFTILSSRLCSPDTATDGDAWARDPRAVPGIHETVLIAMTVDNEILERRKGAVNWPGERILCRRDRSPQRYTGMAPWTSCKASLRRTAAGP